MFASQILVLKILFLLFCKVSVVHMVYSQKHVAEKVWHEHCSRNALALNDCNWCHCDTNQQYICTARICDKVDMFGHFNDAIKEVDVGMEGRGVWRSADTECEAGVHYRKGELTCVCTDDGNWPNPVCRDIFQVLHSVEATKFEKANNQTCSPNKLYQVGCNVCYCSSSGKIDENLCTKKNCSSDIIPPAKLVRNNDDSTQTEVYAACERAKQYQFGCKTCVCITNNRLLCDNCESVSNMTIQIQETANTNNNSFCSDKIVDKRFKNDCNICFCDQKDIIHCTVLKCLGNSDNVTLPKIKYETVKAPVDDPDCVPGTKYDRECNNCHCFMLDGVKYFGCTIRKCIADKPAINETCNCLEGKKYEKNCLICNCVRLDGEKRELCTFNEKCRDFNTENELRPLEKHCQTGVPRLLDSMHGYCEPLHIYEQECNKCRCLSDGKMISCTSKICTNPKSIVVEFIPFLQKQSECPKGHKYKVDCNVCHCMSNGNALCTTSECKQNAKKTL